MATAACNSHLPKCGFMYSAYLVKLHTLFVTLCTPLGQSSILTLKSHQGHHAATAHVHALCCHLPTAKPTRMASNISHIRGTIVVVSTAIILVATAIVAATSIATTPELSYDCCYHFTSTNYHYAVTHIPHPHHHAKNCMYPVVYQPLTTISISISIEFFTENEWGLINHCYCY